MEDQMKRSGEPGKGLLLVLLAGILILTIGNFGCSKDDAPDAKNGDPIAEYGNRLLDSYEHAGDVAAEASLESLRSTVRNYKIMNNRYPASLEEIAESMGNIDISPYDYDPETGTVTLKAE